MKSFFNKKLGLTFLTLLIIVFSSLPASVFAEGEGCLCNGKINSGSERTDFSTFKEELKDACMQRTYDDKPIQSQKDCDMFINRILNSPSQQFSGTCTFDMCGNPNAKAEAINKKLQLKAPVLEIIIPDLKFTELQNTVDEDGNIQIPWIGEYLKAIYRLAVSAASILGVVMLIREGLRIILSAGGDEKVQGYKNIGRVMTGLLLAWLSYVILYNLNSDLVGFRALKVRVIEDSVAVSENDNLSDTEVRSPIKIKKNTLNTSPTSPMLDNDLKTLDPLWPQGGFTLDLCKQYENDPNPPPYGVMPQSKTVPYKCPGIEGATIRTIPSMQAAVCKAGEIAQQRGYTLRIGSEDSSYRSFKGQVSVYCKKWRQTGQKPSSALIATPGYSNHGRGVAIDVSLKKDGQVLVAAGSSGIQCTTDIKYIAELADIFYTADPDNFYRLESEVWHFEYGLNGASTREQTRKYPKRCNK